MPPCTCSAEAITRFDASPHQIFAVEGLDRDITPGFPFTHPAGRGRKRVVALFARGVAA